MDPSNRSHLSHLVKEWIEGFWNVDNPDTAQTIANRCLLPTAILHGFELGNRADITFDKVLNVWKTSKTSFPDLKVKINEYHFADCSRDTDTVTVFARYTVNGTHSGSLPNLPASSKTFSFTGMVIDKINHNRIVEEWNNFDGLGLLEELGYIPPFIYPLNPSIGVTSPRGEMMKSHFPLSSSSSSSSSDTIRTTAVTTASLPQSTGEPATQVPLSTVTPTKKPSSSSTTAVTGGTGNI